MTLYINILKYANLRKHFIFSQPTPFQLPTLPRISSSTHPDSSKTLALYKSCTYLLNYLQRDRDTYCDALL